MVKNKWVIYARGQVPLHRIDVFDQFLTFSKKFFGKDFSKVLYINEGDKVWWGWDKYEIDKMGRKLLKILSNKGKAKKHIKKYEFYLKKGIEYSEKVRNTNLKNLSNLELVKLYNNLDRQTGEAASLTYIDLDVFDDVFEVFYETKIKELIGKKIKEKELSKIIRGLSIPAFQSFISREEIEMIEISLRKKSGEKELEKLHNKFWWVSMGWENAKKKSLKNYFSIIKKYRKDKNIKKELKRLKNYKEKVLIERNKLINRYQIKKEIRHWLNIIDKYTFLHDLRKEHQIKWFYSTRLLMIESAKRLNIPTDSLIWFRHKEVCEFLKDKAFDKTEADKRKMAICLILKNGKISIWSGKEAFTQHKKEIEEKEKSTSQLEGKSANRGIVTGIAKVCNGVEEAIKKVRKGDILITGMTSPEYLPAMRKVIAIVTNEGGITCHAAIISRELNIPCIIGTKIATKALKDGDLIEVDANKGIVKILKKQSKN